MRLEDQPQLISGVGPQTCQALDRLGITTLADLLEHTPRRYQDFSKLSAIANIKDGQVTIQAKLVSLKGRHSKRGLHISQAIVSDASASLAVIWFNQPFRLKQLVTGRQYFLSGEYGFSGRHYQLKNPNIEPVSSLPIQTARILPIYPLSRGVSSAQIRRLILKLKPLFKEIEEILPETIIQKAKLTSYGDLLHQLHFPTSVHQLESAQHQLSLRQLFAISLGSELLKQELSQQSAPKMPIANQVLKQAVAQLPFNLTDDQRRLTYQVLKEMDSKKPMNRLIQGDVAAGKTIIALLAALSALQSGAQVALMAPTALLASQHYQTSQRLLSKFIPKKTSKLLIAQTKDKQAIYDSLANGQTKLVIGTQALIQDKLKFADLKLVIVDEQHRFGVKQRQQLSSKAQMMPHILSLTATPIPRSLQLTMFRELAVSSLKQKPAERQSVTTKIIPLNQRRQLFQEVLEQATADHQLYIVCPAIDSDEVSDPVLATTELVNSLKPNLKYALLHGRQKTDEREQLLDGFTKGQYPVMITTSVIEAGIDVATANTIVIMSPERFGLAQLHQLRGRVGRANQTSTCYLCQADNQQPSERLQALVNSSDGFYLSELDLEIRGPGEIYGTRQSGALSKLTQLDFASEQTRQLAVEMAQQFVSHDYNLLEYPKLKQAVSSLWQITNLN